MGYGVTEDGRKLILELAGGVTARDVSELTQRIASSLKSGAEAVVRPRSVDDVDTSVLQMLVSLRKTVGAFTVEEPSEAFVDAVDRCALRRQLLPGLKHAL